ncbi:hypothetical protein [Janibacter cremeus]|uniref:Uncharacterized protein n=1 Tax=Janibacter cremeus TaxID=1285192 RepID=A0A852VP94_9MICO|nr:hypothetical protein [Janibacter cremeus]NYF97739.1 hypothetical protein [Janibacter cremeus]
MGTTADAAVRQVTCRAKGVVVAGHGVASGRASDSPFARGTIALQAPHFAARGLDLTPFVMATVNRPRGAWDPDLAPYRLQPLIPWWTFPDVEWTQVHGPETFSFLECRVRRNEKEHEGLVHLPHPETKPMHQQPSTVVELLLPPLPDLAVGEALEVALPDDQAYIRA